MEINAIQFSLDSKTFIDPKDKQTYQLSFPKENFDVFFSSGLGYKAEYFASDNEMLYVTDGLDLSLAKAVTARPLIPKSDVQVVDVSFPENVVITKVIENGKIIKTIANRQLRFYYQTGNTSQKNQIINSLNGIVKLLVQNYSLYHQLHNGTVEFPDGTYTGAYVGTKFRNGKGIMLYKNEPDYGGRWRYEGEWKNNERNGQGVLTSVPYMPGEVVGSSNNIHTEVYTGVWKYDRLEGYGTYEKGFEKYEGNFASGKREGKGKSTDSYHKTVYEGEWKNGKQEGKGILKTSSGTVYDGEWKNGLLHGQVIYISGNDKYSGGYINDLREGYGTFTDGKFTYIGEWKKGKQEGKGEYIWANGDRYTGMWKENYRQGKGIMVYANGEKYDGEWKTNKKHGQGSYAWNNGNNYSGEWFDNEMHGEGTMVYVNGDRYTGGWRYGKQNGIGVLYDKNNKIIKEVASDMERSVINTDYLLTKTILLKSDKVYFVNYIITDTTFLLYIPSQFTNKIYFDVNNNNKVDEELDLYVQYYRPRNAISRGFLETPKYNEPKLWFSKRENNNIFEFTFKLKDIASSNTIAFQICFKEGINGEKQIINLPKRKNDLDFKKGKMYYIKLSK